MICYFLQKIGGPLIFFFFSIFHSHLSYGLSVWGKSSDCYLSKLCLLQKNIVRAITCSDFKAHSAPIFKNLGILEIRDIFKYKTTSLMFTIGIFVIKVKIPIILPTVTITDMVITHFHTMAQRFSIWQRIFPFAMIPKIRQPS